MSSLSSSSRPAINCRTCCIREVAEPNPGKWKRKECCCGEHPQGVLGFAGWVIPSGHSGATNTIYWGSAFAVYLGVADAPQSAKIATYFKAHYAEIVQHGQIRHLPGGVYSGTGGPRDSYQNGAYWATPTGWFVYTLDLVDSHLADQTVIDMVNDFRNAGACEWIFGSRRQRPHYLASASLPLAGIRAMIQRRKDHDARPAQAQGVAPEPASPAR